MPTGELRARWKLDGDQAELYNCIRLKPDEDPMATTAVKRQIIRDAEDNPIAVILPMEEFVLVRDLLDQRTRTRDDADTLATMKQAAQDPLFLADLRETMSAFAQADAEWWESPQ